LKDADEYAEFQSNLAVYHDDYGDYSTNEPTMDGTASLIYLLAAKEAASSKIIPAKDTKKIPPKTSPRKSSTNEKSKGAIIRGNTSKKKLP
jgi:hypothetical protein